MISRKRPIPTAIANRIPLPISGRIAGEAELRSSPTVKSRLPSRTSATRLTTKPVYSTPATSETIEPSSRRTQLSVDWSRPWIRPAITKTTMAVPIRVAKWAP